MKHIKRSILTALVLSVILKLTGCEQEDLNYYIDCDYCLEEVPVWDTLWVYLTINDENPEVPLTFYIGDFESGTVDWVDTAREEIFPLVSKVDVEYTVKATYFHEGFPVIAVDADKMRVVNGEEDCYYPCFYVRGGTLDVRLKQP